MIDPEVSRFFCIAYGSVLTANEQIQSTLILIGKWPMADCYFTFHSLQMETFHWLLFM